MILDEQLRDYHDQMIIASSRYVNHLANCIYIYYVSERYLLSFDVFYKIDDKYVERGELNQVLSDIEFIDESDEKQNILLDSCLELIKKIRKHYAELGKPPHTECFMIYDVDNNKLDIDYIYDARYETRPDHIHMTPEEEFDKWFDQVKSQGL
ncbi:hypothetical protein [Streptococcus sp. sy018]|uniref:hypothetical protein n=1 Tax=Streptococcus sp. sy018 TaxID=2600147 RepID=UPI0011B6FF28|nr:hypothetical protein [Streptococcus sp. sy018]TWS95541.1 hypothetical protein FRX52_01715 [Streptococcus sp. sy018]